MPSSGRASRTAPDSCEAVDGHLHREDQLPEAASADLDVGEVSAAGAVHHRVHVRVDRQTNRAAARPVLSDYLVVLRRAAGTRRNTRQRLAEGEIALLLDCDRLGVQRAVDLAEQLRAHHQVADERGDHHRQRHRQRGHPCESLAERH